MNQKLKKTVLYLGLDAPQASGDVEIIHYPIIRIAPRNPSNPDIVACFSQIPHVTHLIFTSKNSVKIFADFLPFFGFDRSALLNKTVIAVGGVTAQLLKKYGMPAHIVAHEETAEGVVKELKPLNLSQAHLFWPHSALSRPIIQNFFEENQISYCSCILYDTYSQQIEPIPDLAHIDEIVFTSPSCVQAFLKIFGPLPKDKILKPIGPITASSIGELSE